MQRLYSLNLIHLFGFYLAAMFLLGLARRLEQYINVGRIVVAAPGRWPNLLQVMKRHRAVFLTWTTFRPAALALGLTILHTVASRVFWPKAQFTAGHLLDSWLILPMLLLTGIPMLGVDLFFLVRVGRIDRTETEKYLDKAESWLTGWKAPVVRFVTLGYVDPRRMVSEEVRKALTSINDLMNRNLYWMSLQVGLRMLFGLAIWTVWACLVRD